MLVDLFEGGTERGIGEAGASLQRHVTHLGDIVDTRELLSDIPCFVQTPRDSPKSSKAVDKLSARELSERGRLDHFRKDQSADIVRADVHVLEQFHGTINADFIGLVGHIVAVLVKEFVECAFAGGANAAAAGTRLEKSGWHVRDEELAKRAINVHGIGHGEIEWVLSARGSGS